MEEPTPSLLRSPAIYSSRGTRPELTPKGEKVLGAIYQRQVEWSLKVMADLRPHELAAIADALNEIGGVLEADIDTPDAGD